MTYTFRPGDLPRLDLQVDRGTDFKAWKTQWEAYLSLFGLGTQSQRKQVQVLTLCFTRETLMIVENVGLSETQRGIRDQIVEGLMDGDMVEDLLKESDLTLEAIRCLISKPRVRPTTQ